jgi:hypothetical protein
MSIAAYNITDILSSTQRPDRPAALGTEPYDIQNATTTHLDTSRANYCLPIHRQEAYAEQIGAVTGAIREFFAGR